MKENKLMMIGLQPEYNYPGDYNQWKHNNTYYASNHGASLIARSIIKEFDAEPVTLDRSPDELNSEYDACIIAFATHITSFRDVSPYTEFIKKLDMPVYLFSAGVSDYSPNVKSVSDLHPSLIALLRVVSERSSMIGVRGTFTASLLLKAGFRNVYPVGCPTLYSTLKPELPIQKKEGYSNPTFVFHRTACENLWPLFQDVRILGQDFLDEVTFTDNLNTDEVLLAYERKQYLKFDKGEQFMAELKQKGVFVKTFDEWFGLVGQSDFVFGPRLHGCIAALIQGIPAVMLARDLRVKEIADFFDIPFLTYKEAESARSIESLYDKADYSRFEGTYKQRYTNFVSFVETLGLKHNFNVSQPVGDFGLKPADHNNYVILNQEMYNALQSRLADLEAWKKETEPRVEMAEKAAKKLARIQKRFPLLGKSVSGNKRK